MKWPSEQEHFEYEYERFAKALDRTASRVTGQWVAHQWLRLMARWASPSEMIVELRRMADELEKTGIH